MPGSQSKSRPLGRSCTCTQLVAAADFKSAASSHSSHEGEEGWSLRQELHPRHPAYETDVLLTELRSEKWSRTGDLHPALPITGRRHRCLCLRGKIGGSRRACSPGRKYQPDLISNESRLACPVRLPKKKNGLHARNCTLMTMFEASHVICYITRREIGAAPRTPTGSDLFCTQTLRVFSLHCI